MEVQELEKLKKEENALKRKIEKHKKQINDLKAEINQLKEKIPAMKRIIYTRTWFFHCPFCKGKFGMKYKNNDIKIEPFDLIS